MTISEALALFDVYPDFSSIRAEHCHITLRNRHAFWTVRVSRRPGEHLEHMLIRCAELAAKRRAEIGRHEYAATSA